MTAHSRAPQLQGPLFRLLAFCLLPLVAACANMDGGGAKHDCASADPVLGRYARLSDAASAKRAPVTVRMSLRAGSETSEGTDSRRVTALLWSNETKGGPIRLDVSAGVGAIVANARESADGLVVFLPRDNKALACNGEDTTKALRAIGVPLPLDLAGLSALVGGRYSELFEPFPAQGLSPASGGGAEVALASGPNRLGGSLALSAAGLPLRWKDAANDWTLDFAYDDGATLPKRLSARNREGRFAVVVIKTRETPSAPFNDGQMTLNVPAGAIWRDLVSGGNAINTF